ncbi:TetR/AcrR family transcriptional regulator [Mycobacterium sp. ACS4331]|uniref:TetR/AcrR family transcriptional regulator n=1 Tax=Mycobacterium sp. ACS4331 TaxID=1834121 RepID=UPI0009EE27EE|nr:TetR/AcrR family transcriptional regulator [Mycobacterium sp. ACS4331]
METTEQIPAVPEQTRQTHRGYGPEVTRILDAAVRVMSRSTPQTLRVCDIIAEAGTCNKTFYRHFSGKDDLVMTAMERGIGVVTAAIADEMSRRGDPVDQVACWVEGLLEEMTDPHRFRMCRATVAQLSAIAGRRASDEELMAPLRALLTEPLAAMGRRDPGRDGDAVFHCTMGTLRRHLGSGQRPPQADVAHLVQFCLSGVGVEASGAQSR